MPISPFAALGLALMALADVADAAEPLKCIMYWTGQHPVVPAPELVADVTHVALAFMNSATFNAAGAPGPDRWPRMFATVAETRSKFAPGTKVMIAIGGWGDTEGFEVAARDGESRSRWAGNVAAMVRDTGADGVDVDWEYPGGNGEDYKRVPNSQRAWEIAAYPLLLRELRAALGAAKLISAAVPGLERDMLAFTPATTPEIAAQLDFVNVMTYDLMNRRDNVTKHHTGAALSLAAVDAYVARGAPAAKLNLGFAFYVKWFKTDERCRELARKPIGSGGGGGGPVGCPTLLLEDPETGADMGRAGGFSWHDGVPHDVAGSFARSRSKGAYDEAGGGYHYLDAEEDIWWTYDTPEAMVRKFPLIVEKRGLGGVFAWGLGEDAPEFVHLKAVSKGLELLEGRRHGHSDEL